MAPILSKGEETLLLNRPMFAASSHRRRASIPLPDAELECGRDGDGTFALLTNLKHELCSSSSSSTRRPDGAGEEDVLATAGVWLGRVLNPTQYWGEDRLPDSCLATALFFALSEHCRRPSSCSHSSASSSSSSPPHHHPTEAELLEFLDMVARAPDLRDRADNTIVYTEEEDGVTPLPWLDALLWLFDARLVTLRATGFCGHSNRVQVRITDRPSAEGGGQVGPFILEMAGVYGDPNAKSVVHCVLRGRHWLAIWPERGEDAERFALAEALFRHQLTAALPLPALPASASNQVEEEEERRRRRRRREEEEERQIAMDGALARALHGVDEAVAIAEQIKEIRAEKAALRDREAALDLALALLSSSSS